MPSTAPITDIVTQRPDYWEEAKRYLGKKDRKLAKIIAQYEGETLQSRGHAFHTLARSIVGQQISVKAADSVWARFMASATSRSPHEGEPARASPSADRAVGGTPHASVLAYGLASAETLARVSPPQGGSKGLSPLHVLAMTEDDLRACGLSRSKALYMHALAEHFHTQDIHAEGYWHAKTDDDIIKELIAIKGIGVWTAEMFLIFHLMRPDVYPLGDIGLLNAVERLYGIPAKDKKAIRDYGERWRPFRTVATWYFWRSLDPVPVEY